jgi:hypothetical protein
VVQQLTVAEQGHCNNISTLSAQLGQLRATHAAMVSGHGDGVTVCAYPPLPHLAVDSDPLMWQRCCLSSVKSERCSLPSAGSTFG